MKRAIRLLFAVFSISDFPIRFSLHMYAESNIDLGKPYETHRDFKNNKFAHWQRFAFIPKACPSAECNKKVIEEGDGAYRCEKCNKTYPDFKYRLMLLVSVKWHLIAEDCSALRFVGNLVHHMSCPLSRHILQRLVNENSEVNTLNHVARAR